MNQISIYDLSLYLSKIAHKNNNFLIKPSDLKILYIIFFWEFISNNNNKDIESDKDLILNEKQVNNIIKHIFNSKYSKYLENISNL